MEVLPISTLEGLLSWHMDEDMKKALAAVKELQPKSECVTLHTGNPPEKPFKTLICHDFDNGYKQDRFVFGSNDDSAYRFYHWSGIDTFVYFSHHLVTIPPCGWVEAAHTNGVKMLGTFITEWDAGSKVWQHILQSETEIDEVTTLLVDIAVAYKFDGWLLNVENTIDKNKIPLVLLFVKQLTKKMHTAKDESEIIWYDSVTIQGELVWQNELNCLNKPFFDCCDGIFLNYTWNDENLKKSFDVAQHRYIDVYVGLDVYGRNFYKGGGYNTDQALKVVRKYNLSAAIFAQAWTYAVMGGSYNFFANENSFWSSLNPYLLFHGPTKLPLKTSFCSGFGKKSYFNGLVVKDETWFNLCRQNVQPIWEEFSRRDKYCNISTDKVYDGGSSLSLWFDQLESVRFLFCALPVDDPLNVKVVYQANCNVKFVSLRLTIEMDRTTDNSSRIVELYFICEMSPDCQKLSADFHTIDAYEKVEKNSWKIRSFNWKDETMMKNSTIKDCQMCCQGPGVVTLGQLSLSNATS